MWASLRTAVRTTTRNTQAKNTFPVCFHLCKFLENANKSTEKQLKW